MRARFASLAGLLVQIDLSDNPLKSHGFAQVAPSSPLKGTRQVAGLGFGLSLAGLLAGRSVAGADRPVGAALPRSDMCITQLQAGE